MQMEAQETLTSLNISVLVSQKDYLEKQALLEGLGTPSEYLRQLIQEDQRRKAQEELEQMLLHAIESDKWIEGTPEYWAQKRSELAVRRANSTKANP